MSTWKEVDEEFKQMEKAHIKGNLIKTCERCDCFFKPSIKYKHKTIPKKLKNTIIKISKNGKIEKQIYEKQKIYGGMWYIIKTCEKCREELKFIWGKLKQQGYNRQNVPEKYNQKFKLGLTGKIQQ